MDDGFFVAGESSDVGINVKWVWVTAQSINESLVDVGLILDDNIRLSVGTGRNAGTLPRAFKPTSSQCPGEDAAVNVISRRFLSLLTDQISSDPIDQHRSFLPLIDDINQLRTHLVGST